MPSTILIKSKQESEIKEIRNILDLVFIKPDTRLENPELISMKAEEFLRLCRDRKAMKSDYEKIQAKLGITPSQYYNILKKLKGVGLIEMSEIKSGEEQFEKIYIPSSNFTRYLRKLEEVWENWR